MSEVLRVNKHKDFTVMSNHHLRDKEISLKAKGLLSIMLSLPDKWKFSLKGLAALSFDGLSSVRTTMEELKKFGYVECRRLRNKNGHFGDTEYIIHEIPALSKSKQDKSKPKKANQKSPKQDEPKQDMPKQAEPKQAEPKQAEPMLENPILDNPILDNPTPENPTLLNTNKSNTKELNTDFIKYPSINYEETEKPEETAPTQEQPIKEQPETSERWIDRYNKTISAIKKQISYDDLIVSNDAELINDIVSVMTEVFLVDTPYYTIENKKIPAELVRINYRKITYNRLDTFLLDFSRLYSRIKNPKNYLITALYNIASTAETSITNRVNHDMYGGE